MVTSVFTGIRTVSIPIGNQDDALRFYSGSLGFTVLRDHPLPVAVAGSNSHQVVGTLSSRWSRPGPR
jgi:catechol 2,3-dioxygenase-like lactoylglutathione lyase family enzyme